MENKQLLIRKIQKCDLSETDKIELINELNKDNVSLESFLKKLITVLKVGSEILKWFDIDIG